MVAHPPTPTDTAAAEAGDRERERRKPERRVVVAGRYAGARQARGEALASWTIAVVQWLMWTPPLSTFSPSPSFVTVFWFAEGPARKAIAEPRMALFPSITKLLTVADVADPDAERSTAVPLVTPYRNLLPLTVTFATLTAGVQQLPHVAPGHCVVLSAVHSGAGCSRRGCDLCQTSLRRDPRPE